MCEVHHGRRIVPDVVGKETVSTWDQYMYNSMYCKVPYYV